jgi:hypothetical protein
MFESGDWCSEMNDRGEFLPDCTLYFTSPVSEVARKLPIKNGM